MTMTSTEPIEPGEPSDGSEVRPPKVRTRPSGSRRCSTRDHEARDVRLVREARPAPDDAQPGDVHRRGRQRPHDDPVLPEAAVGEVVATASSPVSSPRGCGSRCCSPTSRRRSPKGAARRRPTRSARRARRRSRASGMPDGTITEKSSNDLLVGDECVVVAGELIPGDGEIIEGIASVDESAITGESAPVIRESGGDRSAVTGGTRVLSDEIIVRITSKPGETFLDRMIALVEGASRQKTPNEIALNILLAGLTIIFLLAVVTLQPFAIYSKAEPVAHRARRAARLPDPHDDRRAALGDRHRGHGPARAAQRARDERAGRGGGGRLLDAAARQDRHHHLRQPPGRAVPPGARRRRAHAGRRRDAVEPRRRDARGALDRDASPRSTTASFPRDIPNAELVAFTAQTRMSGVDFDGHSIRKGAADSVRRWVVEQGGTAPDELDDDRRRHRDPGRHAARGRERQRASSA